MKTLATLDIRTDFREFKLPKGKVLKQLNRFNKLTDSALEKAHGRVLIERLDNGKLQLEVNNNKDGSVTIKSEELDEDFPKYLFGLTKVAAQVANSDKYEAVFMTNNPMLERLMDLLDKVPDNDLVAEIIGKAIPEAKQLSGIVSKKVSEIEGKDKEKKLLMRLCGVENPEIKDADLAIKVKDSLWDKTQRLEAFIERLEKHFGGEYRDDIKTELEKLGAWLEVLKGLHKKHRGSMTLVDLCPSMLAGGRELGASESHKRLVSTTSDILEALALEPVMAKKMMGLEDYFLSEKVPENA